MKRTTNAALAILATITLTTLPACHRTATRPTLISIANDNIAPVSLSIMSPNHPFQPFVSLGAGDILGWSIHQKDIELAAKSPSRIGGIGGREGLGWANNQ